MADGSVVVFLGSPRHNGYSSALALEAARGAKTAGLKIREYDLNDRGVRGCQGCYYCRGQYGCSVKDYLAPMYGDIAEATGVIVASPIYFYQVTGQAKLWVDRMFPMIDGEFRPRQPGKKAFAVFAQHQDNPNMFKAGIDWLTGVLKFFGWDVAPSLICCGEPEEHSPHYLALLKQAFAAGEAMAKG